MDTRKETEKLLHSLSDRVWYLPHCQDTDRPSIGVIVGDRAAMLIDGGNSIDHAEEVLRSVRTVTDLPVRYIGLTHWHWDHSFGLSAYEDAMVIAHPLCQEKLSWLQGLSWDDASLDARVRSGEEIPFCAENIKKEWKDRSQIKIRTADLLTEGGLTVDLGGLTVECFHIGGEHSPDSMGYYVPQEQILFLGDALCHNMFTGAWTYDLSDFERRLDTFRTLPVKYYVNSHWAPQNAEEFHAFAENMKYLGRLTGNLTDPKAACSAYETESGKAPDADTRDLLRSFAEGNLKRLEQERSGQKHPEVRRAQTLERV